MSVDWVIGQRLVDWGFHIIGVKEVFNEFCDGKRVIRRQVCCIYVCLGSGRTRVALVEENWEGCLLPKFRVLTSVEEESWLSWAIPDSLYVHGKGQ